MTTAAIIVAAGRGTRAGGELPKQWQLLAGQPVVARALAAFRAAPGVHQTLLVIHPDDRARAEALPDVAEGAVELVEGGASRDASVRNALEALAGRGIGRVLIHDGARPLVDQSLIARMIGALDASPGAAPAVPVSDALWRGEGGRVVGTQDRTGLFRAQTPQAFRFEAILAAHRTHPGGAADDVEVARAAGLEVAIVEGCEDNLKVTYPGDFARAERLLAARPAP
ncbi:2-C-methyl-D-erythritol 4-phosphate cytidylyltransferase [Cereibacter sediminicola]|uniref:2-C-methyl-D-erythritol 4-phosphate cytidylyltransferase n=1 Tax=Cereibacter sediminicola TaxID=2584941 RepID=UPI0011A4A5F2|nr:2-C-methyl-D-erythritol 4-phosphate cytidylyltransferase [Cereibacter sediminicola]